MQIVYSGRYTVPLTAATLWSKRRIKGIKLKMTALQNFSKDFRFLVSALMLSPGSPITKAGLERWGVIGMMKSRQERAWMGEKPQCPDCENIELRRQGRIGFLQRVVLTRFGLFPWECGQCRKVYMLPQRSIGYRQHTNHEEAALPVTPQPLAAASVPAIAPPALKSVLRKPLAG